MNIFPCYTQISKYYVKVEQLQFTVKIKNISEYMYINIFHIFNMLIKII